MSGNSAPPKKKKRSVIKTTPPTSRTCQSEKKHIKTFVFCDLESTSLPEFQEKIRVMEITLRSAQRDHLLSLNLDRSVPRVQNKLVLCINPHEEIQPTAKELTGLSNEILVDQSPFDDKAFVLLEAFLNRLQHPVCLVAHYGLGFHFRLLCSEIAGIDQVLPDDILCVDSREAFRTLIPNKDVESDLSVLKDLEASENGKYVPRNYELKTLYKFLKGQEGEHTASTHTCMLLDCVCVKGLTKPFIDWAEENYQSFNSVGKLW